MMTRKIRIATCGVAHDYRQSLVPLVIESLGREIMWVQPNRADLIVFGPFYNRTRKKHRWLPRPLRPLWEALIEQLQSKQRPLTLFQTGENLRHDHLPCDYSLSFDLAVEDPSHFRFPYWMEMVDWSHEGIAGNRNPRFGKPLDLDRLMRPLGDDFLRRPFRTAIFASHLREPRRTLFNAVRKIMPTDGFGPYFDPAIRNHSASGITKLDVLAGYAFNLCPENGMYPGYYSEKIPEAFMAGCLPLTWVDGNVSVDFNPNALVNLAPMTQGNFAELPDLLQCRSRLERYAGHALLLKKPTIQELVTFLKAMVDKAAS
jgi:hypothetical protein